MHGEISKSMIWYSALGLFIIFAGVTASYAMKPTWLGFEHKSFVESHQYIESRKTEVNNDIEKYYELGSRIDLYEHEGKPVTALKAQQRAIGKKIKAALSQIPISEHPEGASQFK